MSITFYKGKKLTFFSKKKKIRFYWHFICKRQRTYYVCVYSSDGMKSRVGTFPKLPEMTNVRKFSPLKQLDYKGFKKWGGSNCGKAEIWRGENYVCALLPYTV